MTLSIMMPPSSAAAEEDDRALVATEIPAWVTRGRIPCLDGLRAVAILLVLGTHAVGTDASTTPRWLLLVGQQGGRGVDLFFVLSGFLITLLLLREQARTGTVSLRNFYLRRVLRIMPAYVAYLAFVFLLCQLKTFSLSTRDWLAALTYTSSLPPQEFPAWEIAHTWSLSVEEHFYLVWPLLLYMCRRRTAWLLLVASVALIPVIRYLLCVPLEVPIARLIYLDINFFTITRIDTIGAGCLLALLASEPSFWDRARWLRGRSTTVLALAVLALLASSALASASHAYTITVKRTVDSSLIAAILLGCVLNPGDAIGRFLNLRPIARLGVLSYSIYLWQQPFLNEGRDSWMCRWPMNMVLIAVASVLSYTLIEAPFLRWKERCHAPGEDTAAVVL